MSTDVAASSGGGSTGGNASSGGGSTGEGGGSSAANFMGWGDGWRMQMAKGSTDSEKEMAQLARYESPEQIWRKTRELERKFSSGEARTVLPKDATSTELAAWRVQNGVPPTPEDYKVNMAPGKKPPEEDSPFLKAFLKSAHDSNYTQAQVDQAITAFYQEVDRQADAMTGAEKKATEACEDQLHKDWGGEYRGNKAMAENLLARAPAGFRDRFMNGFLADHTPIKASPDAWKWLVQLEREVNPAATVLPGQGGELGTGIAEEIKTIRGWMRASKGSEDHKKYWGDEKMQERYRQLLSAQTKLGEKAKQVA